MKTFFIDTNVFEQCHDLKELPWNEVAGGNDVLLIVSRPVQDEIDKHKHDGNSRRARRARRANALFRELISAEKIELRSAGPRVEVSRVPPTKFNVSPCRFLDLTRTDDRIILEALVYRDAHPDEEVALLSHDTGPLGMATDCGLAVQLVPDTWLLPPEPDERDRRIAQLEELTRRNPKISIVAEDTIRIVVHRYSPFPEAQLDELVCMARKKHPLVADYDEPLTQFERGALADWYRREFVPPTEAEMAAYRDAYESWLTKVREFFAGLPSALEVPTRYVSVTIGISNDGGAPAEHLMVEFGLQGGLLFSPKNDEDFAAMVLTSPPSPPKGQWVDRDIGSVLAGLSPYSFGPDLSRISAGFPDVGRLVRPIFRDNHAVYWKGKDARSPFVSCECEEFRHKVGATDLSLTIVVPDEFAGDGGSLLCLVTAKNLPEPARLQLPIEVEFQTMDAFDLARKLVETKEIVDLRFVLPNKEKED